MDLLENLNASEIKTDVVKTICLFVLYLKKVYISVIICYYSRKKSLKALFKIFDFNLNSEIFMISIRNQRSIQYKNKRVDLNFGKTILKFNFFYFL